MPRGDFNREANRSAGLFTAAYVLAIVVLALLGHLGLPDALVGITLFGLVAAGFLAAALSARTMHAPSFFIAERGLSVQGNGVAMAAGFISGAVFIGLAGAYFENSGTAVAMTLGWSLGFAVMSVLIAPYFRRSEAYGIAGFLSLRFGGRFIRTVAALVIVVIAVTAIAAALSVAARIGDLHFGLDAGASVGWVVVLVAIITILGGMRSISAVAVLQYLAAAIAFLAPAILISATRYSVPLPQFSFGMALQDVARMAEASGDIAAAAPGLILANPPPGIVNLAITVVTLAAGVAVLPHLVMRCGMVADGEGARRSVGWALVFVLIVILTAPAYAAFGALGIHTTIAGTRLVDLPAWVNRLGQDGLMQICGVDSDNLGTIFRACGSDAGMGYQIQAKDIALSSDGLLQVWHHLLGLPHIVGAVIAVGAISALLAVGSALSASAAHAIGHDIFGRLLAPRASAGRRLIVTRIAVIAVLAISASTAMAWGEQAPTLASWSIALSAGGLFPAATLAVWWRRTNVTGASAGMIVGFLLTLSILGQSLPDNQGARLLDVTAMGLTPLAAGLVGMAVGFAVAVAGSLATARPTPRRNAVLDAVRRPGLHLPELPERD